MIYASDLDQTLIYSRKAFRLNGNNEPDIRLIEMLNGEEISFMTEKAIAQLKEIAANIVFIPVTTRTVAQYARISIFQNDILTKYAITSNGGNIVSAGIVDQDWNRSIQDRMANECALGQDVLAGFNRISHESWVQRGHMADNLFHYFIVERDLIPMDELQDFNGWLEQQGWNMSLQGRKIYLVPQVCNKRHAIEHIMSLQEDPHLVASGDSLLDLCLLEAAEHAIAPAHGEIFNQHQAGKGGMDFIHFTKLPGILSSEETLDIVWKLIQGS